MSSPPPEDALNYDLVVIGCGIAGLSAAVTAGQAGADVAVLERAPYDERGGNTRYTESFLRMKDTDHVADDFVEALLNDFQGHPDPAIWGETLGPYADRSRISRSMSFADPDVVAAFADDAGPTLRWLEGCGVRFDALPTPFITTSTSRLAPVGGGLAMVEALTAMGEELGVHFYYETTAEQLLVDDAGTVTGVRANKADRRTVHYSSSFGIVLASGGFQGNSEMLAQYLDRGLLTRPVARGGYFNRGEGIKMALDIGAAPSGNYRSFHAEPVDPRSGLAEPALFIFPYGILVNKSGRRFVDEGERTVDAMYERVTRRVHEQPDGIAYIVLDDKLTEIPNRSAAIRTDQPPISANNVGDLAKKLGIDEEALISTVEEFNSACDPRGTFDAYNVDGLTTSGLNPPKSNWARPLDTAPFAAYPMIASNVFTFGGLKVGVHGEVVDGDGRTIDGLFAAGEVIGMYFTDYTGSTSVLKGAVFGRRAALRALSENR